jgi:hypothetical protein
MGKKYTQEQVKNIFANGKCELLDVYLGANIPVTYRCSCGNISDITLANFLKGNRCANCGKVRGSNKQRLSATFIKQFFLKQNCVLLDVYINAQIPMKYKCICGTISYIRWDHFRQGTRCINCQMKKQSGIAHYKWNPNREQVKQNQDMYKKCHQLIANTLEAIGHKKKNHTFELLGYTAQELLMHLHSFDTWNDLQNKKWHIDHKFPVIAFLEHGITDLKVINSLDNLRPLLGSENCSKGGWYDEECFLTYCKRHSITVVKKMGENNNYSEREVICSHVG